MGEEITTTIQTGRGSGAEKREMRTRLGDGKGMEDEKRQQKLG